MVSFLKVYPVLNLLGMSVLFSIVGSVPGAGWQAPISKGAGNEVINASEISYQNDAPDLGLAELFAALKEAGLSPRLGASKINGVSAPLVVAAMSDDMAYFSKMFDYNSAILVLPLPNQVPKTVFLVNRANPQAMYVAYTIPVAAQQNLLIVTPASQIAEIASANKPQASLSYEGYLKEELPFRQVAVSSQSVFMFDDYRVLSMAGEVPGRRAEVMRMIAHSLATKGFEPLERRVLSEFENVPSQNDSSIWVKDHHVISIQVSDLEFESTKGHESLVGVKTYETFRRP